MEFDASTPLTTEQLVFTADRSAMHWFKCYSDIIYHEKICRLPADRQFQWIELMCLATRYGFLPSWEEIEFKQRVKQRTAEDYYGIILYFYNLGVANPRLQFLEFAPDIADETRLALRIRNWDKWQHGSRGLYQKLDENGKPVRVDPTQAERAKRYRTRKKGQPEAPEAPTSPEAPSWSPADTPRHVTNHDRSKKLDYKKEEKNPTLPDPSREPQPKLVKLPEPHWRETAWKELTANPAVKSLIKNSTACARIWFTLCDEEKRPAAWGEDNRALDENKNPAGIPSYDYFQTVFLPGVKAWLRSKEVAERWSGLSFELFLTGANRPDSKHYGYGWVDKWEPAPGYQQSAPKKKSYSLDEERRRFEEEQRRLAQVQAQSA